MFVDVCNLFGFQISARIYFLVGGRLGFIFYEHTIIILYTVLTNFVYTMKTP